MESGAIPRRHSGPPPAQPQPTARKRSTDSVGGPSRNFEVRNENYMAYAYRVAANECKRWWRQDGEHEQHRHHGDIDVPDDRDEYQEIINRIYLGQVLQELSPKERETLHHRFIKQMSVKEAAAAMGVSEGTVKGYTRDALRKLRAKADGQITKTGEEEQ
ncbi:RNA polymerase sigma factor [Streptomyces sp. NPDC088812]|uniref:RNA polymerase sigma factor n=1 Tax=Streptomyces sp. NPDC088812 TaxID=3365905 RepID=UPI00380C1253